MYVRVLIIFILIPFPDLPPVKQVNKMVDTENQPAVANGGGDDSAPSPLEKKIIRQIEHYFGDYNLPRDKFIQVCTNVEDPDPGPFDP
jgi:hypothetical protein